MNWTSEKPRPSKDWHSDYYWVWSHHYPDLVIIMAYGETSRDGPSFFDQDLYMKIERPDYSVPASIYRKFK